MTNLGVHRGDGFYLFLLLAPAVLILLFYAIPVFNVLLLSVTYPEPGLQNYEQLHDSRTIHSILRTTAFICFVTTVITVLTGYVLAYRIVHAGHVEARALLVTILIAFWISVLIRAFAWVALLQPNGLINSALMSIGVIDRPLALVRNEIGVIIGMVHYMMPYAVLPLLGAMRGIDPALGAAARSLGATKWQTFARVFLPLSLPGVAGATILVFILALGFYITPAILGGGRIVMIAEYISLQMTETLRWGIAAMLAVVMLVIVAFLVLMAGRALNLGAAKAA